jgi:Cupredoxin-like domain
MKLKFIAFIAFSILFSASCQKTEQTKVEPKVEPAKAETKKIDEQTESKVEFATNPVEVKKDEQTELSFTVKNDNGETVKDLKIVHEKPMHLLVVSADLSEFYHLHPEPQADGSFKVPFAFANGGKYKLYADLTTNNGKQTVKSFDLDVKGELGETEKLTVDTILEQRIGGIRVEMKPDGEFIAGKEILSNFLVTDILTKKPSTDLQNYLGEKAHFVVISQDLKEFVHAHPISNTTSGGEHNHGDMKPAEHSDATVSAHIVFPKAGIYKLWAQFQRNGRVIDVPFVINVVENKESTLKTKSVEIPKDAYKIVVSKDGFMPSEVKINPKQFTKIAFLRIDNENCASEVVFPTLNIKKKLPLNELVLVDLPKDFQGELGFACGMDMFKGKVITQ